MIQYLISGVVLGLSAGIAPGPILALVITETLRYGIREGVKVSLVPLITDMPIILLTLFLLDQATKFEMVLGGISIAGSLFVMYLAYETFQSADVSIVAGTKAPRSIQKGVTANLLNPHPYLFWLTVGSPMILKAAEINFIFALIFVGVFYILLVGSKILLAVIIGKNAGFLSGKIYRSVMRFLGAGLVLLALFLLYDSFELLGILEHF